MTGVLKDKRLHKLLTANVLSSIGSGVTMIGVPWLLVNRAGGDELYGYAALCMTLLLFFVSPYVGVFVDMFSRKKILLFSELFGFAVAALFAVWGALEGAYHTWQLIAVYFGGSLYYTLHYTAQFAFNQEIFDKEQYKSLNSVMEIQNQAASMVAGGLTSVLLGKVELYTILFVDAATYIVGFLLISLIPYTAVKAEKAVQRITVWSNMKEGFTYLKEKPMFIVFYMSSLMPYIGVMVGNYLFPIYIAHTLHANGTVMGLTDTMYAIGAILGGYTIPFLMTKLGAFRTVLLTVSFYTIGTLIIAAIPAVGLFLALKIMLGWGNSGSRVARNTIMMNEVPNEFIGRANSFFNAAGMLLRVGLIGIFAKVTPHTGVPFSLFIVGFLLIAACIGVIISRSLFHKSVTPAVKTL
ncbi:MFS transporter [Aneurinibacillus tyrosinisolvens]|uniref:MFS transporter n=1 Tax=Aneurinibacillus tyrosinisolvens TaxID=1443435 RepID=UPI00063F70D6|nr:MFS transporter [Aneurinibacillus tyrosinisolvens]